LSEKLQEAATGTHEKMRVSAQGMVKRIKNTVVVDWSAINIMTISDEAHQSAILNNKRTNYANKKTFIPFPWHKTQQEEGDRDFDKSDSDHYDE
jgi:hypothetical protein